MGAINLNLTDDDVLVPEGEYPVTVGDVIVRRKSGVMGDLYLSWHLSIDEGPHAGQGLWMISSLRSDMLRMFRSQLRAVGVADERVTLEWGAEDERGAAELRQPELEGREAVAVVVHDEWDGEMRTKVKRLLPKSK